MAVLEVAEQTVSNRTIQNITFFKKIIGENYDFYLGLPLFIESALSG